MDKVYDYVIIGESPSTARVNLKALTGTVVPSKVVV